MNNNTIGSNLVPFQAESTDIVMEPPLYFAEEHVWNVCFHPTADILACSEITGMIEVLAYSSEDVKPLIQSTDLHKSSARYCTFNPSGTLLASCGEDKRLSFLDGNGKVAHIIKKAHSEPINRCKFIRDEIVVSGDDDGMIKIWDLRTVAPVFTAEEQSQAITSFAFDEKVSEYELYSSCLNGTIAVYDIRQSSDSNHKILCMSDSLDEEVHGLQIIKDGKYVVCSTGQGCVMVYKRDQMEHHVERIQGQPGAVDAIIKIDENTVITGSEDGFLRGVSIYPNKILHVLGQHEEEENFPVQSLSLSRCKRFVASSSHDNSIKFYDISDFVRMRQKFEETGEQIKMQMEQSEQSSAINYQIDQNKDSDFEDDSDDDSDSDDEEEEKTKKKKKKSKKLSIKERQKEMKKDNVKSFFKGL